MIGGDLNLWIGESGWYGEAVPNIKSLQVPDQERRVVEGIFRQGSKVVLAWLHGHRSDQIAVSTC